MSGSALFMLSIVIFILTIILMVVTVIIARAAYHGGVRDGYQNTFLPHVQNQIRDEGLKQGEEVRLP